jgi:hypothetical protein
MSQKVPKVDVEKMSVLGYHDVGVMSIADSKHISSHRVPSTTSDKVVKGSQKLRVGWVVF